MDFQYGKLCISLIGISGVVSNYHVRVIVRCAVRRWWSPTLDFDIVSG